MFTVLDVVAPVFAIVVVGYLAVRVRLYPAEGVSGLISFVNNFATPCLLFRAMLSVDFEETFDFRLLLAFYAGAVIIFILGAIIARSGFRHSPGEGVAAAFSATYTNLVLLGLPVVQRAFGDEALPVIFTIIGTHPALLMTGAMLTMEWVRRDAEPISRSILKAAQRIASNPLLIGVALGLVANLSGLQLPMILDDFTQMMALAIVPVALFGLGGALNNYALRDNWLEALIMSLMKLVLHPLIVWILLVPVLNVDHRTASFIVLLSAMPSGINVYIFATYYNRSTDIAANTVLIGTALSVVTVSGWLYFLTHV